MISNPNLPKWRTLLRDDADMWSAARVGAKKGPRVLVATGVGGGTAVAMCSIESLVGVALTMSGAQVEFLACDQSLPACKSLEMVTHPDPEVIVGRTFNGTDFCRRCRDDADFILGDTGLPLHWISAFISPADRCGAREASSGLSESEIRGFRVGEVGVGEHAWAGALRYFARGDLQGEVHGLDIARRYLEAAILTHVAFGRILEIVHPEVVVSSHGLYIPYGVFAETCRAKGVRYVAWNIAYRKRCLIFSHEDSYHHTMLVEPVHHWESRPMGRLAERELVEYLESRLHGANDWIWFHEKAQRNVDDVWTEMGLGDGRPVVGLLTNVIWDAQLHYRANAYETMMAWVVDTVDYFAGRPDMHLLIRVHPAEVRGTLPSRQRVMEELGRLRPRLPENVHVIDAHLAVSTYGLMERCDAVAIFGTKTGVELASMGIPVIVAGEAWIRNKGISDDARSPQEYRRLLDALPRRARLSPERIERARRYARHFFFRRMIPIKSLEPAPEAWPPFKVCVRSLRELAPGVDAGMDVITTGILEGAPFVFDGEGACG